MNCKNCGATYNGNFCPKCGRPAQAKSPTYYTGQIVSMFLMIAGLFGMVVSIGSVSAVHVMSGQISLSEAIVTSSSILYKAIGEKNMSQINFLLIPLFYISLLLLITASIFFLLKKIAIKNILASVAVIITSVLSVVIQSPINFFIALNVGLLIFMLLSLIEPNQHIWNSCWAITLPIIFVGNLLPLVVHQRIPYGDALVKISLLHIFMLLLWCIPCIVNLVTLFRLKRQSNTY